MSIPCWYNMTSCSPNCKESPHGKTTGYGMVFTPHPRGTGGWPTCGSNKPGTHYSDSPIWKSWKWRNGIGLFADALLSFMRWKSNIDEVFSWLSSQIAFWNHHLALSKEIFIASRGGRCIFLHCPLLLLNKQNKLFYIRKVYHSHPY